MQNYRLLVLLATFYSLASGAVAAAPIHDAAKAGDVKKVEQLLAQGININTADELGNTALHYAVAEAQIEMVNLLFARPTRPNLDARNKKGETPLHLAGSMGRPKTVTLLIEKGAEINTLDNEGKTALCRAAFEGRPETIQALLDKGADIKGFPSDSYEYDGRYEAAPLESAVQAGKRPIINLLLEKGAPITDFTLLPLITRGERDMLQFLLDKGAKVGGLAMAAAVAGANRDMITYLADKGGVIDFQILTQNYGQQLDTFDRDMFQFILSKGRDAKERATPLLLSAIMNANLEQAAALIDLGVNVNGRDIYGNSPLHRAAEYGYTELCRLLLKKGADIGAVTERGNTPLHKAVVSNYVEVVKVLLDGGANVNAVNEIQITPLHMAAARNQAEIIGLFLRKGADITLRSYNNLTAGEVALNSGYEDLARVLGAKPAAAPADTPSSSSTPPPPAAQAEPVLSAPAVTAPGLVIKAPIAAENGAVVPFMVSISPELKAGDQLAIYVNDELACAVKPGGNITLTSFSTRLRMSASGQIHAVATRQHGGQTRSSANIQVTVGAIIPASGRTGTDYKTRTRGDELLVLYNNDMARDGYIKTIMVKLQGGAVEISATPRVSQNPLLGFKTPNSLEGAVFTTTLHQP